MDSLTQGYTDIRLYLQDELVRRCKANSRYSLRAFARDLRLEPSVLSKLLNRKRTVSRNMLEHLNERLEFNPVERDHFQSLHFDKNPTASRKREPMQIEMDVFRTISDWYHFAILELVAVVDFNPSSRWIAKALGISVNEVNSAVDRLLRLGLLEIDAQGRWHDVSGDSTTTGFKSTNTALRKMQRQLLEKSIEALASLPLEVRDHSSMTMAIDASLLPQAKAKIKKFRRELLAVLQKPGKCTDVYHLTISFFPSATTTTTKIGETT